MEPEKYIALSDLRAKLNDIYEAHRKTRPNMAAAAKELLSAVEMHASLTLPAYTAVPVSPGDPVWFVEYSEHRGEYYVRSDKAVAVELREGAIDIRDGDGVTYPFGVLAFSCEADAQSESVERNLAEQCWEEDNSI